LFFLYSRIFIFFNSLANKMPKKYANRFMMAGKEIMQ
jgi:hypothetical protein